ncbi:hypothetical protein [Marinomonas epiphytica]
MRELSLTVEPAYDALIEKASQHQLVAIGDAHFHDELMSFVTSLVIRKSFHEQIQHIIVEFGNSRYQSLLDDYLLGKPVSDQDIKQVWQDALYFTAWAPKVYSDFFKQIRSFNQHQKKADKIRVTLAEASFDWREIESSKEWQMLAKSKVTGYVNTINGSLRKNEKALLIFGAFHTINLAERFSRNSPVEQQPLVSRLKHNGYDIYTVWPVIQPKIMAGLRHNHAAIPGLMSVENGVFRNDDPFVDYFAKAKPALMALQATDARAHELFDAMLYLGSIQPNYKLDSSVLEDSEFIRTASRRVDMIGGRVKSRFYEIVNQSIESN